MAAEEVIMTPGKGSAVLLHPTGTGEGSDMKILYKTWNKQFVTGKYGRSALIV